LSLRIDLDQSTPTIGALLAQPQAAIVDVSSLAPGQQPVGSGAFMLRRYRPDTDVVLERDPDYFRRAAKLQRLVYRIIPDAATRRLELKYGGVDISPQLSQLSTLPADDAASFAESGAVDVLSRRSQIVRQLEFNNLKADSPIRDRRVREAMAWAVDYEFGRPHLCW
jgi:peptide/nickel transport system substrate-binding protein